MDVFFLILFAVLWLALVIVATMRPLPSTMSRFELERRAKLSEHSRQALRREARLGDLLLLQRFLTAFLLAALALIAVVIFGWAWGIVVIIAVILISGWLEGLRLFTRFSARLYERSEPFLLRMIEKTAPFWRFFRASFFYDVEHYRRIDSKEQLVHLIEQSEEALSPRQRRRLSAGLRFSDRHVSEVMTPQTAIISIAKNEFLGPLVLHELHDTGHSRLPVIDKDINHVVGILYLRDLLSLDVKKSVTAEKAMDKKVEYIHQDDTLEQALVAFLRTRHHLFIVRNDAHETVGLLCLEDVIEALLGEKIVDEDGDL